ncbi:Cwf15/Cwc15 cell cycle control protein [Suillus paluster]|uniref:Cwf15/Cwc15 cell cycle control protein n=1 Tax=Suillus paluster TaxID=48578 RepID=UPI001B86D75A|nr:Cwf15/Cwc15 cell cycle control protein [Suillus paluster]KAG1739889.1 Cwf15/Cwc15 cell cycle control protein [Suillus paluster]
MSTAHRPTWDPAQARDVKGGSRQFSVRDMAAHTKLKFRQAGQTSVGDRGNHHLPLTNGNATDGTAEDEANKRRKLLQEALELDKDDDDDDEKEEGVQSGGQENGEERDEESEEESDEEDETAELMRELEKIKKERAEEKARLEREQNATAAVAREAEIATSNPLLNLAAALGQSPGVNTTVPGTFSVKRRWDDDLIFKNQAANQKDKSGQFVNDLLRTEFHKKFMAKFIK